jgi:hypothetical protein
MQKRNWLPIPLLRKLRTVSVLDAINDISTFSPVSPAATAEMERAQRFIKDRGVRHVIRVQAGLPLSGMQLARKRKKWAMPPKL